MKKNMKIFKVISAVIAVLALLFMTTEYWGRGILYPRFTYTLNRSGSGAEKEISVRTSRGMNPFKSEFTFDILTEKPAENIRIISFSFTYDGKTKGIVRDKSFPVRMQRWQETGAGLYENRNSILNPPEICWSRHFKGKKTGDTFPLQLTIVYSLDNGPEKKLVLDYTVSVSDYFYVHPLVF